MSLYKYRSNDKRHLDTLVNNEIFAALPIKLNDPFELKFNDNEIRSIVELSENLKKYYGETRQKLDEIGIYSLSEDHLSISLWSLYANESKGFCIEYNLDLLLSFFAPRTLTCHSNVVYEVTEKFPEFTLADLGNEKKIYEKTMLTKHIQWSNEKEYRLVFEKSGQKKVHPQAIKAIYFGEKMPKNSIEIKEGEVSQECVMNKLKGRNIKYFQVHSRNDAYKLYTTEIEDLYKNYKKISFQKNNVDHNTIDYESFKEMNISQEKLKDVISFLEVFPSKIDYIYARKDEIQGAIIVISFENYKVLKISIPSLRIIPD